MSSQERCLSLSTSRIGNFSCYVSNLALQTIVKFIELAVMCSFFLSVNVCTCFFSSLKILQDIEDPKKKKRHVKKVKEVFIEKVMLEWS